jgi:putative transposase
MSRVRRREMVDREHQSLSTVRQCALLGISRAGLYYRRIGAPRDDLVLMDLIDQQYLSTPFYGSRRMKVWLWGQGYLVNRKRVQRLMRTMGLQAIYRKPRTSRPGPGHKVYPYLLGSMKITRPNSFRGRMGGGHHLHANGQGFLVPGPSGEGWIGTAGM